MKYVIKKISILYISEKNNEKCSFSIYTHTSRIKFFPKCGVTECSTAKDFVRLKINRSAVSHIFTGERINVALLNRNAL